jgi:cytochrome c-type biogenesis protein
MNPDAAFQLFTSYATGLTNVFAGWARSLPVSFAFGAGMVATVNPCGFIMLPSFAAFYLATDDGAGRSMPGRIVRAGQMGLCVSLAFVVTFAMMGFAVTLAGNQLIGWTYWAGLAIGIAMLILGAFQLVTRRSVFGNLTSGVRVARSRTPRGVMAFGFAYALVSLGCTLPIFMLVVGSVFTRETDYLTSTWRFVEYGAGMGLVLMLIAVGVAVARQPVVSFVAGVLPYIEALANLALTLAGLYVTWYWWKALT